MNTSSRDGEWNTSSIKQALAAMGFAKATAKVIAAMKIGFWPGNQSEMKWKASSIQKAPSAMNSAKATAKVVAAMKMWVRPWNQTEMRWIRPRKPTTKIKPKWYENGRLTYLARIENCPRGNRRVLKMEEKRTERVNIWDAGELMVRAWQNWKLSLCFDVGGCQRESCRMKEGLGWVEWAEFNL